MKLARKLGVAGFTALLAWTASAAAQPSSADAAAAAAAQEEIERLQTLFAGQGLHYTLDQLQPIADELLATFLVPRNAPGEGLEWSQIFREPNAGAPEVTWGMAIWRFDEGGAMLTADASFGDLGSAALHIRQTGPLEPGSYEVTIDHFMPQVIAARAHAESFAGSSRFLADGIRPMAIMIGETPTESRFSFLLSYPDQAAVEDVFRTAEVLTIHMTGVGTDEAGVSVAFSLGSTGRAAMDRALAAWTVPRNAAQPGGRVRTHHSPLSEVRAEE